MTAPANLSKVQRLQARDGDLCWLCDGKLDFSAEPNSKKAPTIEHLLAKSRGGTNDLENLRLTHPGCNRQLGDRPVEAKHKMRAKQLANRKQVAVSSERKPAKAVVLPAKRKVAQASPARDHAPFADVDLRAALRRWQVAALVGWGAALLATGLTAGLLIAR